MRKDGWKYDPRFNGKRMYSCWYHERNVEVEAESKFMAQQIAARMFSTRKLYQIDVIPLETDFGRYWEDREADDGTITFGVIVADF